MSKLESLKNLIGEEIEFDDIICCFDDTEEEIIVEKSSNMGYDYIAYENIENSTQYLFTVDNNQIITDVQEY